nr:sulfite exporter TauE/SafE family protein [Pseudomonas mosselii]
MDPLYLIALGAIVAGFVQGLSGFAFGMVAMSFWAWGLEPKVAAVLTVFGSLTGQLIAVFSVRRGFSWSLLWPFVLGGLAGIPLGVWVLPYLDMLWFKAVFGTLLVVWCPLMLLAPRLPRLQGGRLADGAVGMVGGGWAASAALPAPCRRSGAPCAGSSAIPSGR